MRKCAPAASSSGRGRSSSRCLPSPSRVVAALPQPWDPAQPSGIGFTVRNTGSFATPAGTLSAALADPRTSRVWSGNAELPGLPPGEETTVALIAAAPDLAFGSHRLRYAAEVPGGRFTGSRPLKNAVSVDVAAAPAIVGDGGTLGVTVDVANVGNFSVSGTLTLEAAGLLPAFAEEIALAPGAAVRRDFSAAVTEATPIWGATPSPPASARPDIVRDRPCRRPAGASRLPPAAGEIAAGDTLAVTAVNSGRNTGVFAWSLRLLAVGTDPDDPLAAPLAQASGTARLASAESVDLTLAAPRRDRDRDVRARPRGARCALGALLPAARLRLRSRPLGDARRRNGSRGVRRRGSGDGDGLAAQHRRTPRDAVLEWSVAGAGAIEPVVFAGTVHVSPAGDDALGDGSVARPFATPQRGVDAAPPGHRVLLLAGTYGGGVVLRPGTILQGEVVAGEPAAVIADADIFGDTGAVVDHLAVRNGNIVFPGAVRDVRVTDCVLEGGERAASPRGQGIVFQQGVSRVLIGRNRLSGYRAGRAGVQFFGAAADILVHENVFSDFSGPDNNGVVFWGAAERRHGPGERLLRAGWGLQRRPGLGRRHILSAPCAC